jgi:hypothetical protein
MPRKKDVFIYWDNHLKGHAFCYTDKITNTCIVSDGVYDTTRDCEDSAYLCCFGDQDTLLELGFRKKDHCKTVSIH